MTEQEKTAYEIEALRQSVAALTKRIGEIEYRIATINLKK